MDTIDTTNAAEVARNAQAAFKRGAAYLATVSGDKKRRLILTLAAVVAAEVLKDNRTAYSAKMKDLRKNAKDKTSPAFLDEIAALEAEIVTQTISDVADTLADSVDTLAAEVPDVTAAIRLCLENPRQTIADGVKRVDFACRHLSLTADSRKATAARVDSLSGRWAAEQATDNA